METVREPTDSRSRSQRMQLGIARWVELMDVCEEFLLAGMRRKHGSGDATERAYREWLGRVREEHDRGLFAMMEGLARASRRNAG